MRYSQLTDGQLAAVEFLGWMLLISGLIIYVECVAAKQARGRVAVVARSIVVEAPLAYGDDRRPKPYEPPAQPEASRADGDD